MEKIREIATLCVGRAVLFGSLAIACVMVAFSFSPVAAFRSGAVLTLIMSAILMFKAMGASLQDHRSMEVWLYLDERTRREGPKVIAAVMREVYARFAQISLMVACGLFAMSLLLMLLGFEPPRLQAGEYPAGYSASAG